MKKMIKKLSIGGLAVLLAFIYTCQNNPVQNNLFKISGYVHLKGKAISGAQVNLDKKINYMTQTNNDGYFEIDDVSKGEHKIYLSKDFSDSSFVTRTYDVDVNNDIVLESLTLPVPVKLYPITSITSNSAKLIWSRSYENDFREYKIYRHTNSGLDENTGTLVHVTTFIEDTTFIDNSLFPTNKYYYRVYVMNEYGKLGGSNIELALTKELNLIQNGNFELLDNNNFPEKWEGSVTIDSLNAYSGKYSVKMFEDTSFSGMTQKLRQIIDPAKVEKDSRYKLSFWWKSKELSESEYFGVKFEEQSGDAFVWKWFNGPHPDSIWQEYNYEFTIPSSSNPQNYQLVFMFERYPLIPTPMTVWVDSVSLKKISE